MLEKIRQLIIRPPFAKQSNLTGKKVIITGAAENSLGFATAKTLLLWGAEVTVTRRSHSDEIVEALKAVTPSEVHSLIHSHDLDLSDAESVKVFAKWYETEHKHLNILINNAGIHLDLLSKWKEPKLSNDHFEIQWRTNYLGTSHLTQLLLPLLKERASATGDARIVNVVSMLHNKGSNNDLLTPSRPYNSWEAYGNSKLALVHMTMECQKRFQAKGLQAFCLHPGSVYTNVAGKGLTGNPMVEKIRNSLAPVEKFFLKTPLEGAQTQIHCATAEDITGGQYFRDCKPAKVADDALDSAISSQLWQKTLEWVNAQ